MSRGSTWDREYRYLDLAEIDKLDLPPCEDTPEEALKHGLLDLIQFTEEEGLPEETVDRILREIIDLRAARTRSSFSVLDGGSGGES